MTHYNFEADPMKDAIKDFNERINNTAREVEHSRNKILNIEERTSGAFDKITEEMKTNIYEMDDMDDKIEVAVTKALSEHELGENIMEALAECCTAMPRAESGRGNFVCSLQQRAHGSRTHDKEIFDIELGLVSTLVPCNE